MKRILTSVLAFCSQITACIARVFHEPPLCHLFLISGLLFLSVYSKSSCTYSDRNAASQSVTGEPMGHWTKVAHRKRAMDPTDGSSGEAGRKEGTPTMGMLALLLRADCLAREK